MSGERLIESEKLYGTLPRHCQTRESSSQSFPDLITVFLRLSTSTLAPELLPTSDSFKVVRCACHLCVRVCMCEPVCTDVQARGSHVYTDVRARCSHVYTDVRARESHQMSPPLCSTLNGKRQTLTKPRTHQLARLAGHRAPGILLPTSFALV